MSEIYIISADDEVIRELKKATFLGEVNICDKDDLRHGILYSIDEDDGFSILVSGKKADGLPVDVDRFVSSLSMDYISQVYKCLIEWKEYSVKFESWSFGGGRDEDRRLYTVIDKDESIIGSIELGDLLRVQHLRTKQSLYKWNHNGNSQFFNEYGNSGTWFHNYDIYCRDNEFFYEEYNKLVDMAMKRDDPIIESKFELSNYDIERKDLL